MKEEALVLQESGSCRTHLLYYDSKLVGYCSLFADYVNIVKSKRESAGWESTRSPMPEQHYPSIRLHYIGVDSRYREMNLGHILMLMVFDMCIEVSRIVGINFIVVEAMESSVDFFKKYSFEPVKRYNELLIMALKKEDIDV
ncbi:GNAT family N-acetyltransferase [Salicibibacter halophilus]|uniref:GNAT family N-acetyltransferase n=1 Tax=Salicibibacter halophilus TaxID=2502791 RepID=UPI00135C92EE|nr:GNAT family N-acetyltransferase [Salicibibacter halophilus]